MSDQDWSPEMLRRLVGEGPGPDAGGGHLGGLWGTGQEPRRSRNLDERRRWTTVRTGEVGEEG